MPLIQEISLGKDMIGVYEANHETTYALNGIAVVTKRSNCLSVHNAATIQCSPGHLLKIAAVINYAALDSQGVK